MPLLKIAVVLKGWPRLSETFVAQEVLGLERRGFNIRIISLRHPTDRAVHDLHRAVRAPIRYLPEYLEDEPARVATAQRRASQLRGYPRALRTYLADYRRDASENRIRRFGQACVLAAELEADTDMIYAHFLHTPASVARYAALMHELPFSVSAHAKDIWTTPSWEKAEKLAEARFCVTCTLLGSRHLQELSPPGRVHLVHHGVDAARFAAPVKRSVLNGSDPVHPVRLLAVARAVPKKGLHLLLECLELLPTDLHWRLEHIGGGPLLPDLRTKAERLGLDRRIDWRGPQPADAVRDAYRRADLFVLPVRVAEDGDRDGLPNVVVEAAAAGLPVLSTTAASVDELVADGVTGRLVPPDDAVSLAGALAVLIGDPASREVFGRAAREKVLLAFDADRGIDRVAALLELAANCRNQSVHPFQ
ncbi:MAG TPA: glycosyltransferase family 4 protein [Geminicoccus sp.]|nr:glycosyltransferase family 4 protein [Geminicoccus sp.]HEX2525781.1 glycosyltransferase family 4 protein [Geminicoccus sp.]